MKSPDRSQVVTRFAPSPTGVLHLGGARTALFNYLFTKQTNGKLILRIEDTDRERSKKEYEKDILDGLAWLSIQFDEIYRQSERNDIYSKYIQDLIENKKAYQAENGIIRFKNPNVEVSFDDLIRGKVTVDTTELGDFVIARDAHDALYHLAVVVDDHEMGVTHIIRGEDGIYNTPRQILIEEAIGAKRPVYAHLPFILAADRSKLSKRHGAVSLLEYKEMGYEPDAMINFLALMGWHPSGNEEIITKDQLIAQFRLEKVQKSGAIFNIEKLDWINREYLKKMPLEIFLAKIEKILPQDKNMLRKIWPILLDRMAKIGDLKTMIEKGELDYFFKQPEYKKELLKNTKHLPEIIELLQNVDSDDFSSASVKERVWDFATEKGRGEVLWPMRVALTGLAKSPDPFTVAGILGKDESLRRLKHAISLDN